MKKTTIISDLDGTLYPKSTGLTRQIDNLADRFLAETTGLNSHQLSQFELSHPNILDALDYFGINRHTYYDNVHNKLDYSALHPNAVLNNLLKDGNINLFVVSLSPREHIIRVLSALGLTSIVSDILAVSDGSDTDKGAYYQEIIKKHNLSIPNICVVGDNYILDIEPAKKLGIDTALISDTSNDNTRTFLNFEALLHCDWFE